MASFEDNFKWKGTIHGAYIQGANHNLQDDLVTNP
jgi:hypothetical protein